MALAAQQGASATGGSRAGGRGGGGNAGGGPPGAANANIPPEVRQRIEAARLARLGPSATAAGTPASTPTGPIFNPAGAERARMYGGNWQGVSAKDTIARIAGPRPDITHTESGKTIYRNPSTGLQVVYDNAGRYFRVEDTGAAGTGAAQYVDQFGKPIPGNVPEFKSSRTRRTGIPPEVREALTHFKDTD